MRNTALSLAILAALALVAGCGVGDLLKRGDQAMQTGRPDEALRYYQEALAKEKKLAEDPQFMATLTRAKTLAAYRAGETLAAQGRWEAAVQRFADALQIDPNFTQAQVALDNARREAAKVRHRQALALADEGKVQEAVAELERALQLDPANADARAALDSVRNPDPRSRDGQRFEQGLAHARKQEWGEAAAAFREAIAANPNHLPARVERKRADEAVARARQFYANGSRLLGEKRLDDAVAALRQALDTWPTYAEAKSLLEEALRRRDGAVALLRTAERCAQDADWPNAARYAGAALEQYPGLAAAREVFARSAFALGEADERRGLWGSAMLWYMDAAEHSPKPEYAARRQAAEARVQDRISFAVAVADVQADARTAAVASALGTGLRAALEGGRPAFVRVAGGADAQAAYVVAPRLAELTLRMQRLRTEPRVHAHAIGREVPNPEILRLRHLLAAEEAKLARMRRDFQRPCPTCRGAGRLTCKACGGTGVVPCGPCHGAGRVICPKCNGTGQVGGAACPTCNGAGKVTCTTCGGAGKVDCPTCSRPRAPRRGWLTCPRCEGTGRDTSLREKDLERQQWEIRRLRDELAGQPAVLLERVPAQWPYTVEVHEKTGRIVLAVEVKRKADGGLVRSDHLQSDVRYEDAVTLNPNPVIGLLADPLQFPADAEVERTLADAVAREAAAKVLDAALQDYGAEIHGAVERFEREGKQAEAVEASADLAMFLRGLSNGESARLLEDLRAKHRAQGQGAPPAAPAPPPPGAPPGP